MPEPVLNQGCEACATIAVAEKNGMLLAKTADFAVLMANPAYNAGHVWILSLAHCGDDFCNLPGELNSKVLELANRMIVVLQQTCVPDGFNVGFNQGVGAGRTFAPHFCIQVVPRWQRDANLMFVGADIKAIGLSLPDLAEKLREQLHG